MNLQQHYAHLLGTAALPHAAQAARNALNLALGQQTHLARTLAASVNTHQNGTGWAIRGSRLRPLF